MVERVTYRRRELCEGNTSYEVKDLTARAGAPKNTCSLSRHRPTVLRLPRRYTALLPDQICSAYAAYERVRLQSCIQPAMSEASLLGYISGPLTSTTRSAGDGCRQAKSVDRARSRLFRTADRLDSRCMALHGDTPHVMCLRSCCGLRDQQGCLYFCRD
jgi:hypothetical protein